MTSTRPYLRLEVPRPTPWRPFSCERRDGAGAVWISVAGELDMATSPQLAHALRRAELGARRVVLDLQALEFMDCSGLRVVLAAHRRLRQAGGQLSVVRANGAVERLISLVGVAEELAVTDRLPAWSDAPPMVGNLSA